MKIVLAHVERSEISLAELELEHLVALSRLLRRALLNLMANLIAVFAGSDSCCPACQVQHLLQYVVSL
jgi:hypothetical protein